MKRIDTDKALLAAAEIEKAATPAALEAARVIRGLAEHRDVYARMDSEAATHVESVICMRTGFTGEPPYVGWKGIGLALNEALDELDRLRAAARKVQ